MNGAPLITLVDDDQNIVTSVSITLEEEGYEIESFHDGEAGLAGISKRVPDLAVLDIKMPRMDGIELLKRLREQKETANLPVIFLTSKDDEIDEIIGLTVGADDYITKPFSQKLLITRIQTLLRRQKHASDNSETANEEIYSYGLLSLDHSRFLCSWDKKPLDLTVTEFLLTQALAQRPGHVKSREQLIDAAYGQNIYVDERTIDSHIKRIRRKFKSIDENFDHIETLYGLGYKYKED